MDEKWSLDPSLACLSRRPHLPLGSGMVASKDGLTPDNESTPHLTSHLTTKRLRAKQGRVFFSSLKSLILNLKGEIVSAELRGPVGTTESLQEAQTIVSKHKSLVSALPVSEGLCGPTEGASMNQNPPASAEFCQESEEFLQCLPSWVMQSLPHPGTNSGHVIHTLVTSMSKHPLADTPRPPFYPWSCTAPGT